MDERSDEVRHIEAIFRSEIDEIQLSIKELGNAHRLSCIPGRSPVTRSSGDCAGEKTETIDSSCQATMKQATNMQVADRGCTQGLDHVELDMVHVKEAPAEEAVAAAEAAAELAAAQAATAQSEQVS